MISDDAVEAAMLEWYGADWRIRFFPGSDHVKIPEVMDAMRRAIEAANAVAFRRMRSARQPQGSGE